MRVSKRNIIAVLCLVVCPTVFVYPEGTKQVMPSANTKGQLCINKSRNNFAFYNAEPEFRLNISVAGTTESIRFGFGKVLGSITTDLVFRIKGPAGNIVYAESPVPSSGKGFITSYTEATEGPFAGGYNYLELKPPVTGDYILEFYYNPSYTDNTRHLLEFFDITVVNAAGSKLDGRVWSKAWQFWSGTDGYSAFERFYGKMMILSDDSIVTQVDCNGFRGGTFSFASNMFGCENTGNLTEDRKSVTGTRTYPQYKVFLNNPDSNLFPTQKVTSGILQPISVNTKCTTGGADFGVRVLKDGTIRLLIQVNPSPGIDPEDVQLIADAKADPGGTGENIITWNGNDGYGRPVQNGASLAFSVTNLSGMTHLPIHDIENNDYGFIVKQIRPAGEQLRIYWDDSQVGGTANSVTGCISVNGCHTWTNDFGNNKIINSWWFVSWAEITGIPFVTKKIPAKPVISGNAVHCEGTGNLEFSVAPESGSISYVWSYSGTGVAITGPGTTATLNFSADATPGMLSVYGTNVSCGKGPESSVEIVFEPLPVVALASFPDMCYTAPGFPLSGGQPDGGIYFVDGVQADSLFPYREPEGFHSIVYSYTTPTGCSNSDTSAILLRSGADCEGTVFFPTAFSPNDDSLNDTFKPVADKISSFQMYVFSRWGEVMFSTADAGKGWDGKFKGEACPAGTYTYSVTYGPSLRSDDKKTMRGTCVLIR